MVNAWIDCSVCGSRFDLSLSACPVCGAPNAVPKKSHSRLGRNIAVGVVVVLVAAVGLFVVGNYLPDGQEIDYYSSPPSNDTQATGQPPTFAVNDDLVQHALNKINEDRKDFGLPAVKLSSNEAAQIHAEDVFREKQISHWNTEGEKPYMTYTRYGGTGNVNQNVAISGFDYPEYDDCVSRIFYDCEEIEPFKAINELEYEMMYNDKECCDDGHRDNILDEYHTHVSIGIAYDDYYFAYVQNFENHYIELNKPITADERHFQISGDILSGRIVHIEVYYDELPTPSAYQQNKNVIHYDNGEFVAIVEEPPPPGYFYEQPSDYALIVADRWRVDGDSVDVRFDLSDILDKEGAYTIYATLEDNGDQFAATSYSVFVE